MRLTRIGGPTALIELEGWRILTDPTFDPPGRTYAFAPGARSRKTTGPAMALDDIGRIDAVLLSHHGHADNLDDAGRAGLERAAVLVTTAAGAKAIAHPDARGLKAGATTVLTAPGRAALTIAATPGRHGAPGTRPLVGPVIGFALSLEGRTRPSVWVSGDTVLYGSLRRAVTGLEPEVAVIHIGAVKFPITGPLPYTMDAAAAVELIGILSAGVVVPVHVEGWSHFSQQEEAARRVFDAAPASVRERIRWLPLGEPAELA